MRYIKVCVCVCVIKSHSDHVITPVEIISYIPSPCNVDLCKINLKVPQGEND